MKFFVKSFFLFLSLFHEMLFLVFSLSSLCFLSSLDFFFFFTSFPTSYISHHSKTRALRLKPLSDTSYSLCKQRDFNLSTDNRKEATLRCHQNLPLTLCIRHTCVLVSFIFKFLLLYCFAFIINNLLLTDQ